MIILPAPQHTLTDEYFKWQEPHHYRFENSEDEPVLSLHRDSDGQPIGVFIPIDYNIKTESGLTGIDAYRYLKMDEQSRKTLRLWFEEQDKKPF